MKYVFLSFKSLLDNNSGAALELKTVFEALAKQDVSCLSCCLNCYDTGDDYTDDEKISPRLAPAKSAGQAFKHDINGVLHYLYVPQSKDTRKITSDDMRRYGQLAQSFLRQERPDVVVFFGSRQMLPLLEYARSLGARIVYYVANAMIDDAHRPLFEFADDIVVPSDFVGKLFEAKFGKPCIKIPTSLPFACGDVPAQKAEQRRLTGLVTLVNPTPVKGGHVFFEIARRFQPEGRPFLCIESRGTRGYWRKNGIAVERFENILWAPFQQDIRHLLRRTALLLMPSLIDEAAGKVIAEAMSLGVPCLGYDVGGIKEQIGTGGRTLELDPALQCDPVTRRYTSRVDKKHIDPWEANIHAMLDDADLYHQLSRQAVAEAQRFAIHHTAALWRSLARPGSGDTGSDRTEPPRV